MIYPRRIVDLIQSGGGQQYSATDVYNILNALNLPNFTGRTPTSTMATTLLRLVNERRLSRYRSDITNNYMYYY